MALSIYEKMGGGWRNDWEEKRSRGMQVIQRKMIGTKALREKLKRKKDAARN